MPRFEKGDVLYTSEESNDTRTHTGKVIYYVNIKLNNQCDLLTKMAYR